MNGLIMRSIPKFARRVLKEERATEALEWGLVAALVVIGAIAAMTLIGPKVKGWWDYSNTAVPAPT